MLSNNHMPSDEPAVLAGDGLALADMSHQLEGTSEQYKPGKFPHLAGSKVFKVPDIPLDEVNASVKFHKQDSSSWTLASSMFLTKGFLSLAPELMTSSVTSLRREHA